MKNKQKFFVVAILIILISAHPRASLAEEELIPAPAAIQMSSVVSDGKLTLSQIVQISREEGMKVVIFTDRDFMKWQYGLWPLRRVIKKTVEDNSVSNYGIKRYLKAIKKLQEENPDLVIIPGVESAPFYYWEGGPFRSNFKIRNWHKHILAIGLEEVSDYRNLPSVANGYSFAHPFSLKDLRHLWPFLLLLGGCLCLRKRKFHYRDEEGHSLGPYSLPWRIGGVGLIFLSCLFLLNNPGFRSLKYDQYHGEQGIGPYQDFINYVERLGGLTFWVHLDEEYVQERSGIGIETPRHAQDLLMAFDYTGFAMFFGSYPEAGRPGGMWDETLLEYCRGARKRPVWAIGGLSFDQLRGLAREMQHLRTVILTPELTKEAVLEALGKGSMYILRGAGSRAFTLAEFTVKDSISGAEAQMGEEVAITGKALLSIKGTFSERGEKGEVKLIKNGRVLRVFEVSSPFAVNYEDDTLSAEEAGKVYYRLEIRSSQGVLVTNPIFAKISL